MHPGPAHLLERRDLADDHLGHSRRAEVHRRIAVDHEDDVAERRDVRTAGRRRTEQAADLRDLPRQPDLVVEDPPGTPATGEELHLVGQPGAGRVDQPEDRHLLGERGLGRPQHLLDRAGTPRTGLHHRVVGDDHDGHAVDRAATGDDAVGRERCSAGAAQLRSWRGLACAGLRGEAGPRAGRIGTGRPIWAARESPRKTHAAAPWPPALNSQSTRLSHADPVARVGRGRSAERWFPDHRRPGQPGALFGRAASPVCAAVFG